MGASLMFVALRSKEKKEKKDKKEKHKDKENKEGKEDNECSVRIFLDPSCGSCLVPSEFLSVPFGMCLAK